MSILSEDQREKILVFPFDLMSHYLRCIVLAKRYSDHNVLFAHSKNYDHFVNEAGFKSFKVHGFDTSHAIKCAAKFDFSWLNKNDIERVFLAQVEIIKTLKPKIVIGDANPTLKMAAEYCGVRYIALMNGYMTRSYARTRKLPSTHPAVDHLSKLPPRFGEKIIQFAEKIAMRSVHKPFKQLRSKYRLKRERNYLSEMEGDENLICDDEKLFPQKDMPLNYKFIGPLLYEPSTIDKLYFDDDAAKKPRICVSMGSTGSWEKLSFLSNREYEHYHIITLGDNQSYIRGKHVQALRFANFDSILPHCHFLICHGGNGTTYQGIKHGIKMICVPDHFEQEWNIQGIEALGYGTGLYSNIEGTLKHYLNNSQGSN